MAYASTRPQLPAFLSPTICNSHSRKACMTCQRPNSALGPAKKGPLMRHSSLHDISRVAPLGTVRPSRSSAALLPTRQPTGDAFRNFGIRHGQSFSAQDVVSGLEVGGGAERDSVDWLRAPQRTASARLGLRQPSLHEVLEETMSSARQRHSTSETCSRSNAPAPRVRTSACDSGRSCSQAPAHGNTLRMKTSPSSHRRAPLSAGRRTQDSANLRPNRSANYLHSSSESDEALMEQILQEEAICVADNARNPQSAGSNNPGRSLGTSGAGDLWMVVNNQGHRFVQAISTPRRDPSPHDESNDADAVMDFAAGDDGSMAHEEVDNGPDNFSWGQVQARNVETAAARDFWQAEPDDAAGDDQDSTLKLQTGLRVHGLEDCSVEVAKLGVGQVDELAALTEQDVRDANLSLNPLQLRRLITAIRREKAAAARASQELRLTTQSWEALCGSSAGWYPPSFSQEPAGLRITVLEPPELAGTTFDLSFGQGRTSISPFVSATPSAQHPDWTEFCVSVEVGRNDRTGLAHARQGGSGAVSLAVEGVSRQHCSLQLLCGDGAPMQLQLRDNGSTNGTFLLRHPPPSFLPPHFSSSPDPAGHPAAEGTAAGAHVRPQTPSLPLLQLRLPPHVWHDVQGVPYVRLGPRMMGWQVLGLTVLQEEDAWFGLQEVVHRTEQLLPHAALRQQGWTEARLEEVWEARRKSQQQPLHTRPPSATTTAAATPTHQPVYAPQHPSNAAAHPLPGTPAAASTSRIPPIHASPPSCATQGAPAAGSWPAHAAGGAALSAAAAAGTAMAAAGRSSSIPAPLPAQPAIARPGSPSAVRPFSAGSHGGDDDDDKHIFLTYQWDSQRAVKIIAEALKQMGFRVWLDLDRMKGEMNKRMAEAVEGAAVVCPCITRAYKNSSNCMKELNYADQRGSDLVPLILDGDCDKAELLSGQVGLITSNLIYVNFGKVCQQLEALAPDASPRAAVALFEDKMKELERALGDRGRELPHGAPTAQPPAASGRPPIA